MRILVVSMVKPDEDSRNIKLVDTLKEMGHSVHRYWRPMSVGGRFRGLKTFRQILHLVKSFQAAIRIRGFDVMHLLDGWDVGLLPFLATRTPKVFDMRSDWSYMIARRHTPGFKNRVAGFVATQCTKMLVRHSDHVTTVDPRLAQTMLRLKPRRWSYLKNRPPSKMFEGVQFKKDGGTIDLGYIGRIAVQRGVHSAVDAVRMLNRRPGKPTPIRLFIAGSYESNEGYWETRIRPFVDGKTIIYLGNVPFAKIAKVYRSLDFNVVPAEGDHWTLKLGESVASKVPIIIRSGMLHRKLLGDAAIYFANDGSGDDSTFIMRAIEVAVAHRKTFQERARRLSISSWEEEVSRIAKVYEAIRR